MAGEAVQSMKRYWHVCLSVERTLKGLSLVEHGGVT